MLRGCSFFLLLFMLSTGSLYAESGTCGLGTGSLSLEAAYLYLLPSVDDTYFAIVEPSDGALIGEKQNNDFRFNSAFRVGGSYTFCNCNTAFEVYYSRLHTKTSRTVTADPGTTLGVTIGSAPFATFFQTLPGTITSHNRLLYQRLDAFFDQLVWSPGGSELNFIGGLEYAYIRLRETYNARSFIAVPHFGTSKRREKTWGIGPQLGLTYDYLIGQFSLLMPGSLRLTTFGSTSLLVSKAKTEALDVLSTGTVLNVPDRRTWRIVPAFHARLGLNYAACFCCIGASLEVGYEFHSYVRALSRELFTNTFSQAFTNFLNFDAHGLYVAVDVNF
jgi:hypothetical protein